MKSNKEYINQLLSHFLAGETTEEEEKILADYFASTEEIPQEWTEYKELFGSFSTGLYDFSDEQLDSFIEEEVMPKRITLKRIAPWLAAACIAGAAFFVMYPSTDPAKIAKNQKVTSMSTDPIKNDTSLSKLVENTQHLIAKVDKPRKKGNVNKTVSATPKKLADTKPKEDTPELAMNDILDIASKAFPMADKVSFVPEGDDCFLITATSEHGVSTRYAMCLTDRKEGSYTLNNIDN